MGRDIINHKMKPIYVGGLLFIMITFNSCVVSYPRIVYEPLDISEMLLTSVKRDIASYEELMNKGSVLYVEFSQIGNRKYSQISIPQFALNRYHTLKIDSLEFEFENKREVVNIDKTFELNLREVQFTVEGNKELTTNSYFQNVYRDNNNIKIYMQKIFRKTEADIGKKIDLTLRVRYSFDDGEILTQEIKYLVNIVKGYPTTPEWMYRLFPGM